MTGNRQGEFMTNDKGYDWDNQWGVGFELSQKEHYYHYFNTFLVFFSIVHPDLDSLECWMRGV